MKRKRFVKLLMALGLQRDFCSRIAKTEGRYYGSYRAAWQGWLELMDYAERRRWQRWDESGAYL